jgi:hypothetical protein
MPFAAPLGAALAAVLPADAQRAWLRRGKQANANQDTRRLEQTLAGIRERGFNIYHPQDDRFSGVLVASSSELHYPTVRAVLAMTQQPLAPDDFDRLGSLAVGTISAAVAAPRSGVAVSVAVTYDGPGIPTRTRCFEIGAWVRRAADRIGEALDEPTLIGTSRTSRSHRPDCGAAAPPPRAATNRSDTSA